MKLIKKLMLVPTLLMAGALGINAQEADSTGMPGDHFSLEGALELFKKANNPEEFEKLLNTEDNRVNNLDLDGNGEIDYINVIEKQDNDVHIFILRVGVSESENQDIAVIELEKTGAENAILQIVGDEEIFGEQTIVEPGEGEDKDDVSNHPGGPFHSYYDPTNTNGIIVNVWFWPTVRHVYRPGYAVWVSPWRWRNYPGWWRPWRPLAWKVYHPYRMRFRPGFAVVRTHRVVRAHRVYTPVRATSVTVRTRHAVARKNYTVTRSRTTVTGPRGNSVTKKTTTVQGRKGKVKASKTTVRKRKR